MNQILKGWRKCKMEKQVTKKDNQLTISPITSSTEFDEKPFSLSDEVEEIHTKILEDDEATEGKDESTEGKDEIAEYVDSLTKFVEHLENSLKITQKVMDKAYTFKYPGELRRRLKQDVNELLCLKNEMRTILDNINSMKLQIAAVRSNIEDHKEKISLLKSEEKRTRFLLFTETSKKEKNLHNQRDNPLKRFIVQPSMNPSSRTALSCASSSSTSRQSAFITLPGISDSDTGFRTTKTTNTRILPSSIKKTKPSKIPRRVGSGEKKGVTLHLKPINEIEKPSETASEQSSYTRRSSPSTSVIHLPWNENQIENFHSDAATDSAISDSNSLIVVSSDGHLEEGE